MSGRLRPTASALDQALDDVPALGRADAAILADQIGDAIIAALRRDRSLSARTTADWRLRLADELQRVAGLIHHRIRGHVRRDDVVRLLEKEIG